jgi:hypothetical protein
MSPLLYKQDIQTRGLGKLQGGEDSRRATANDDNIVFFSHFAQPRHCITSGFSRQGNSTFVSHPNVPKIVLIVPKTNGFNEMLTPVLWVINPL